MTTAPAKAALIAGVLALTGVAVAQAAPPPAAAGAAPEATAKRGGPDGPRHERFHRDPAARAEARAQRMRDVLQLTPQQEPALKTYLSSLQGPPREHRERPAAETPRKALTTPERLDRQIEMMTKRQQRFAERATATKAFYAQLSPSQKKAFDALNSGRKGHGFHGRGPGPMMMGAAGPQAPAIVYGEPEEHVVTAYADDGFDVALFEGLDEDF